MTPEFRIGSRPRLICKSHASAGTDCWNTWSNGFSARTSLSRNSTLSQPASAPTRGADSLTNVRRCHALAHHGWCDLWRRGHGVVLRPRSAHSCPGWTIVSTRMRVPPTRSRDCRSCSSFTTSEWSPLVRLPSCHGRSPAFVAYTDVRMQPTPVQVVGEAVLPRHRLEGLHETSHAEASALALHTQSNGRREGIRHEKEAWVWVCERELSVCERALLTFVENAVRFAKKSCSPSSTGRSSPVDRSAQVPPRHHPRHPSPPTMAVSSDVRGSICRRRRLLQSASRLGDPTSSRCRWRSS